MSKLDLSKLEVYLINNSDKYNNERLALDTIYLNYTFRISLDDKERLTNWRNNILFQYLNKYKLDIEETVINLNLVEDYQKIPDIIDYGTTLH